MDLYIRKYQELDFINDFDKLSNVTLDIDSLNNYLLDFDDYFTITPFEIGTDYKIQVYFENNNFTGYSYAVDYYNTGTTLSTNKILQFENPIEYTFKATTSKVKILMGTGSYTIRRILIIDDPNYKHIYTDEDFNIVYNFNNMKDYKSIILPYSKDIKISNYEFNKNNLSISEKKYKYDCIVRRDGYELIKGELIFKNYNGEYYEANISSKNEVFYSDLTLKEVLANDYVEYSYGEYMQDIIGEKCNYYLSKEMIVTNFLNASNKYDGTRISDGVGFTYLNNTTSWNFNSYIRMGLNYNYLFDLAHRYSNYNYEIDVDLTHLTMTNPFNTGYTNVTGTTIDNTFDETYLINTTGSTTILDTYVTFGIFDHPYAEFTTNGICDITLSSLTLWITLNPENPGDTVSMDAYAYLYTANADGDPDKFLWSVSNTFDDLTTFILWEICPTLNIDFIYSRYGFVYNILLDQTSASYIRGQEPSLDVTSVGRPNLKITIDKTYKIYADPSTICLADLVPANLKLVDIIKNVCNIYNLYPVFDFEKNMIYYKSFDQVLSDNAINLSDKYDINNYMIDYTNFNNKIIYKYNESELDSDLYYDYVVFNNIDGAEQTVEVNAIPIYDNFYSNYGYQDLAHFYTTSYTNKFDVFLENQEFCEYGLGYVYASAKTSAIGYPHNWSFSNLIADIPTISTIDHSGGTGLWFNKDQFNTNLYGYENYTRISGVVSAYDKYYRDYNTSIYEYQPLRFKGKFLLTNKDINDLLKFNYVIIDNFKYIIEKMTISNNIVELELIKYM